MSQILTNTVPDFGSMYVNASKNSTSPTTDLLGAALADKQLREIKENWDQQFGRFNFLTASA